MKFKADRFAGVGSGLLNEASKNLGPKDIMEISMIHVNDIVPNPENKYHVAEDKVISTMDSIKLVGIRQNLEVKRLPDGKFMIITGETRRQAVKRLFDNGEHDGMIPCSIVDFDNMKLPGNMSNSLKERYSITVTNIQREKTDADLLQEVDTMIEFYEELRKEGYNEYESQIIKGRKTRELIAERLGISTGTAQKVMAVINKGVPELKKEVLEGNISIHEAQEIAQQDRKEQKDFIDKVKDTPSVVKASDPAQQKNNEKERENNNPTKENPERFSIKREDFIRETKSILDKMEEEVFLSRKEYLQYRSLLNKIEKLLQ